MSGQIVILFLLSLSFIVLIEFQNPFSSLLSLAVYFMLNVVLLVNVGIEFLALTLAIIYLGAILILFLFIAMTIDLRLKYSYQVSNSSPTYLIYYFLSYFGAYYFVEHAGESIGGVFFRFNDIYLFAMRVYQGDNMESFIGVGLALLVTMICTLGLTIQDVERSKLFINN